MASARLGRDRACAVFGRVLGQAFGLNFPRSRAMSPRRIRGGVIGGARAARARSLARTRGGVWASRSRCAPCPPPGVGTRGQARQRRRGCQDARAVGIASRAPCRAGRHLSTAPPSPRMAWRDPRALRYAALFLALAAGLACRLGALPSNTSRFRRTRRRLRVLAAAHRCVDRSARLYQQAPVAA